MEWYMVLTLILGALFVFLPVAFVWYINAGGFYATVREAREGKKAKVGSKDTTCHSCNVNADCPLGFVCVNGCCVPEGSI